MSTQSNPTPTAQPSADAAAGCAPTAGSALVLDSDWTYRRTGETFRLLYWERDFVLIRKVRGLDGLVGQVAKLSPELFRECYTPNDQAHPTAGAVKVERKENHE